VVAFGGRNWSSRSNVAIISDATFPLASVYIELTDVVPSYCHHKFVTDFLIYEIQ
jgi:hypothetical protein